MTVVNEQELRKELAPNEKLLWNGTPLLGVRFRSTDLFMIPFSIMWCGFAIFWEYSVVNSPAPIFMALWGIPFILIGLYFAFGRFFFDSYQKWTPKTGQ